MSTHRLRGNFSRREVEHLVRYTSKCILGTVPDHYRIGEKFWSAVAASMFESIFSSFLTKSSHGKDDLGIKWKDLSPETKAYNRPDARRLIVTYDNRAVHTPSLRVRPTLPPSVNKQWGGRWLGIYMSLFGETIEESAKSAAGGSTWEYFKALGYPTLIGSLGNRKLPILHKTGALQRSLFPAPLRGGIYVPLDQNQIYHYARGKLTIGTKRPNVEAITSARPLWKKNISPWIDKALSAGRDAVWEYFPQLLIRL